MRYKGYKPTIKLETDTDLIFGEVILKEDVITFQAKTAKEAEQAFRDSVDLYLSTCQKHGREPEVQPTVGILEASIPGIRAINARQADAGRRRDRTMIEACLEEADDPRHDGAGYQVLVALTLEDAIVGELVDYGPNWVRIRSDQAMTPVRGGEWGTEVVTSEQFIAIELIKMLSIVWQ